MPRFYVKLLATLEDKLNEIKEKVRRLIVVFGV